MQECKQKLTIRQTLTVSQLEQVTNPKKVILVGLVNEQGSFAGYHQLDKEMPDGCKPSVSESGTLDLVPIVVGG